MVVKLEGSLPAFTAVPGKVELLVKGRDGALTTRAGKQQRSSALSSRTIKAAEARAATHSHLNSASFDRVARGKGVAA